MNETMLSGIRFALDIALKATLLFSLTAVAIAALRRSGAAARHFAGTAGLIGALALPLLTLSLPRWEIGVFPGLIPSPAIPSSSSASSAVFVPERFHVATGARQTGSGPTTESAPPVVASSPRGQTGPAGATPAAPVPWLLLALAAWTAGALLVAARLAVGLLRVRRIRRGALAISDPEWVQETRRLSRELDVRRPVELLESARVSVAMTSGLLRPLLLLCRQARSWEVERRRVVLLHELAHVRRGDWLWLLLAEAALAFYWWHPLAWVAARSVRRDCERACDDLVLAAGTKPSVYAGHLLGIFRAFSTTAHPVVLAVASERPSHFEGRLRAILDPAGSRRELPRTRAFLSAAALLAAAGAIAVVQPWAPLGASAMTLLPYADSLPAEMRPAGAGEASSPACPKTRPSSRPAKAKMTRVVASASPSGSPTACSSAEKATAAPVEAQPGSGRTFPAILKAIDAVKEAASGFVRASNNGWTIGKHDGSDWYSHGMSLHRHERFDEAIAAFQKAIEAGYREDAASYNIACGYALKGDRDRAFEWLRRAEDAGFDVASYLGHDDDLDNLKSDPRWKALKNESQKHPSGRQEREAAQAVKRYERIAAGSPKSGEAYYDVGKELLNAGRFDLSARAFQAAADRGYRVGASLYNEACAFSRAGEKGPALGLLRKALDAGFDQPSLFRTDEDLDNVRDEPRFAELEREASDLSLPGSSFEIAARSTIQKIQDVASSWSRSTWREAAKKFEDYARAHPQSGRTWFNLGYASLEGDRPEAAIEAFHKALDLGYRKPTTMYNLACGYARLDQKDQAFDWLFKSLDAGFDAAGKLRGDEDLDNLRGDPRFRKALSVARAREKAEDD